MKRTKTSLIIITLLILFIVIIYIHSNLNNEKQYSNLNNEKQYSNLNNEKQYGFIFDYNVNIPPVGKELNLLLKSIESINTIFESKDGDNIVMFKDGRLIYYPYRDQNALSQLSYVYREEGYWLMGPSYKTELIINKVIFSDGEKEKVDISVTTHFLVKNPEDTEFVITDKSEILLLEKDFCLKDTFIVSDTNEKILNNLK